MVIITGGHGTPPIVPATPADPDATPLASAVRARPGSPFQLRVACRYALSSSRSTLPSPSPSICANMAAAVSSATLPPPSTSRSFLNSPALMNPSWSVSIRAKVGAYSSVPAMRAPFLDAAPCTGARTPRTLPRAMRRHERGSHDPGANRPDSSWPPDAVGPPAVLEEAGASPRGRGTPGAHAEQHRLR